MRSEWGRDPPLAVCDGTEPLIEDATSAKEWYQRKITTYVSPAVFALGKNPYPGLHIRRYIPELQKYTPEYIVSDPWMGESMILRHITPDELMRLGCINLESDDYPEIEISPRFRADEATLAIASTDKRVMNVIGNNKDIHSCFRRSNWEETSDAEYEYLKPVLRIVTEMMGMDSVLDLWFALGQPMQKLPQTKMLKAQKQKHRVYYTGRSTVGQRVHTKSEMRGLQDYVKFSWIHDEVHGSTTADITRSGLRPGDHRHACDTELDDHLLYIISGGTQLNASHYYPAASDASAYMRTQLFLANLILHELTHVWFKNVTTENAQTCPFRNDDRAGEEGFALEAVINKNVILIDNEANFSVDTMPFGMAAIRWPGLESRVDEGLPIKASTAKYGIKFHTIYAVPMSYVRQFFLDDFWDNRVVRYGDGALTNYKAVGVRESQYGESEFDDLESPTVKQKQNSLTGLWEDDPEIDSDNEFSDVEEGIIYPGDKALNILGGEISDSDIEMEDGDEGDDDD
ncbi:unnamed protein product, partial [Aureobasidium uvarum]